MSLFLNTTANQTNYANDLFNLYSNCAIKESDLFVDLFNKLQMIIHPNSIGDSINDYLSGGIDETKYPFACIGSDIDDALDIVSSNDKELKDAADLHLKYYKALQKGTSDDY